MKMSIADISNYCRCHYLQIEWFITCVDEVHNFFVELTNTSFVLSLT